jgi:hypothetical protein
MHPRTTTPEVGNRERGADDGADWDFWTRLNAARFGVLDICRSLDPCRFQKAIADGIAEHLSLEEIADRLCECIARESGAYLAYTDRLMSVACVASWQKAELAEGRARRAAAAASVAGGPAA